MSRKKSQSEKASVSVNKQGLPEDAANQEPKNQLEQRAKKKNTKI